MFTSVQAVCYWGQVDRGGRHTHTHRVHVYTNPISFKFKHEFNWKHNPRSTLAPSPQPGSTAPTSTTAWRTTSLSSRSSPPSSRLRWLIDWLTIDWHNWQLVDWHLTLDWHNWQLVDWYLTLDWHNWLLVDCHLTLDCHNWHSWLIHWYLIDTIDSSLVDIWHLNDTINRHGQYDGSMIQQKIKRQFFFKYEQFFEILKCFFLSPRAISCACITGISAQRPRWARQWAGLSGERTADIISWRQQLTW